MWSSRYIEAVAGPSSRCPLRSRRERAPDRPRSKPLSEESPLFGGSRAEEPAIGKAVAASAGAEEGLSRTGGVRSPRGRLRELAEIVPAAANLADLRALLRNRGGALTRRLGALEAVPVAGRAGAQLLLPLLVQSRRRRSGQHPLRGGCAAGLQPVRGTPSPRCADDRAAIRNGAPLAAAAVRARRALVEGVSGRWACSHDKLGLVAAHRDNAQRLLYDEGPPDGSTPKDRRAPASSTGSATGCGASAAEDLSAPQSAPEVPIVPDRPGRRRRGDADLGPHAFPATAERADVLWLQPRLPPFRAGRRADVHAGQVKIRFMEPVDDRTQRRSR